jgi:hypothetical protein
VTIARRGKRDTREVRRIHCPDSMHCGYACCADEPAVESIYGPVAIEFKAPG